MNPSEKSQAQQSQYTAYLLSRPSHQLQSSLSASSSGVPALVGSGLRSIPAKSLDRQDVSAKDEPPGLTGSATLRLHQANPMMQRHSPDRRKENNKAIATQIVHRSNISASLQHSTVDKDSIKLSFITGQPESHEQVRPVQWISGLTGSKPNCSVKYTQLPNNFNDLKQKNVSSASGLCHPQDKNFHPIDSSVSSQQWQAKVHYTQPNKTVSDTQFKPSTSLSQQGFHHGQPLSIAKTQPILLDQTKAVQKRSSPNLQIVYSQSGSGPTVKEDHEFIEEEKDYSQYLMATGVKRPISVSPKLEIQNPRPISRDLSHRLDVPASYSHLDINKRIPDYSHKDSPPELKKLQNPFAAAMASIKPTESSQNGNPAVNSSSQLYDLLMTRKAKTESIKKEEYDQVMERTVQESKADTVNYGSLLQMPQWNTLPSYHKTAASSSLLSNIMGLLPASSAADFFIGADFHLAHPNVDNKPDLDDMPRLVSEKSPASASLDSRNALNHLTPDEDDILDTEGWEKRDNPFCCRLRNLNNFPSLVNSSTYKPTYRSQGMAIHRAKTGCIMNTARTLDLLRQNLQKYINKEIDQVVQKYIGIYFKPGVENIRQNNGIASVSDDHMQAVCQQMLEEAKRMYMSGSRSNTPDPADNVSESDSIAPPENRAIREKKLDLFRIKRRRGSSDSEASLGKVKKRKGRPPFRTVNGRATPSKQNKHDPVRREGAKWDPQRLIPELKFVMGSKANKALGLGAQRGRLYIKHPELFKYGGDQDDKNWLHEYRHMPATGGKAYLLIVEDIRALADSDEYKGNPGLMLNELEGFSVPDWMLEKMKIQMQHLRTDAHLNGPQIVQQVSPSNTDTMDAVSTEQDVDEQSCASPLQESGAFLDAPTSPEDVSPARSEYDMCDEKPRTAPFDIA